MFNTWFILTATQGKQACVAWSMEHLPNIYKQTVYIVEVGEMVNKPRLQVLIYPGKRLVCLGFGGNGKEAMFVGFNLSTNS